MTPFLFRLDHLPERLFLPFAQADQFLLDLLLGLVELRLERRPADDPQLDLVAAARHVERRHVVEVVGARLEDEDVALLDPAGKRPALAHLDLPGAQAQGGARQA